MNSSSITQSGVEMMTIKIVGRMDCTKTTLCRQIVEDLYSKKINKNVKFEFVIAFETPFEFMIEEIKKENLEFINYTNSPVIYIEVKFLFIFSYRIRKKTRKR